MYNLCIYGTRYIHQPPYIVETTIPLSSSFSLASGSYQRIPAPSGEQSRYCILSDGRLFFSTLNDNSAGDTVILDGMRELKPLEIFRGGDGSREQMMLDAAAGQASGNSAATEKIKEELSGSVAKDFAALEGYLTAEIVNIDLPFDVNIDFLPDIVPFHAKGNFKFCCDYTYENPGMFVDSIHTLHMYVDLDSGACLAGLTGADPEEEKVIARKSSAAGRL